MLKHQLDEKCLHIRIHVSVTIYAIVLAWKNGYYTAVEWELPAVLTKPLTYYVKLSLEKFCEVLKFSATIPTGYNSQITFPEDNSVKDYTGSCTTEVQDEQLKKSATNTSMPLTGFK